MTRTREIWMTLDTGQDMPAWEVAYAHLLAADPESAATWAQAAATQETTRADGLYILGHVHRRRGELRQAAAAFEQAWRRERQPVGAAVSWATTLVLLGDLDGARAAFHRAVGTDRYASAMADYLGLLEAVDALTQRARTAPENADVQATLATALWYLVIYDPSQLAACEQAAGAALQHQPDHPDALVALAAMARRRNDLRGAEALYRRAVTAAPRHGYAWRLLALHLANRGQKEEGLAAARQATALDPTEPFFLEGEAGALWTLGRLKEMSVVAEKLVALTPRDADNWSLLGDAYHASERLDDAKAAYLRSLEYDPALMNSLHHLALISKQQGKPADAIRYYLATISVGTDRPAVFVQLADILREEGHLSDSVTVLQRGLAQFRDYGDLHAALCDTYRAMGKETEAQPACARAAALNRPLATR
jgi:tetratricopeptide (TPR) repeat protein